MECGLMWTLQIVIMIQAGRLLVVYIHNWQASLCMCTMCNRQRLNVISAAHSNITFAIVDCTQCNDAVETQVQLRSATET